MKKKIIMAIMLVLSAALLVAASVLGTLAFLASSTAVSNTFTVGEVGIQMFESKLNPDGTDADGAAKTSDGNSYLLIPGKTYKKDPTIYVNAKSVPSYLFVKIKNGIETIEAGYAKSDEGVVTYGANSMRAQMIAKGWQLVKHNKETGEELYLYVGFNDAEKTQTKATASMPTDPKALVYTAVGSQTEEQQYDVFETFTVDVNAAVRDYAGAKVTLTAFAIQTESFANDQVGGLAGYQKAWNAIVGRFPFESGTVFSAN